MKALFKIDSTGLEGHETEKTKLRKLEEYKELLRQDFEITGEKEIKNRRGTFIEITYK